MFNYYILDNYGGEYDYVTDILSMQCSFRSLNSTKPPYQVVMTFTGYSYLLCSLLIITYINSDGSVQYTSYVHTDDDTTHDNARDFFYLQSPGEWNNNIKVSIYL